MYTPFPVVTVLVFVALRSMLYLIYILYLVSTLNLFVFWLVPLKQNYTQRLPKLNVASQISLLSLLIILFALTPTHLGHK